jgi:HPt (histidine-containing phosphotransfer) domain-containing protein
MGDYISKPIKAQELQQMLQHFAAGHALASQSRLAALPTAPQPAMLFDYAAAMTQVDQEVLGIIAQAFVEQWPDDLAKMRSGLEAGDLQAVLHVAHALKGTLSMFGAKPASELAHQIEKNAMRSDAAGAGKFLPTLVIEMDRLIPVIPLEGSV